MTTWTGDSDSPFRACTVSETRPEVDGQGRLTRGCTSLCYALGLPPFFALPNLPNLGKE